MNHQAQLALSLMSVCLMQQRNALEGMDTQMNCLTERMASVCDQNQQIDNHLAKQTQALEDVDTQLLSLAERVGSVGARCQQTNLTLGMVAVCLMQQREALDHIKAMVQDLSDRMSSLGWQRERALFAEVSPAKQAETFTRIANAHRPSRKKASFRNRVRAKA